MGISFSDKTFLIQTLNSSYAFAITESGTLIHLYYGAKAENINDLPTLDEIKDVMTLASVNIDDTREYSDWGRASFIEPALKCTFPDGTKDLWLYFDSYEISKEKDGVQTLKITLKDNVMPLEVVLIYRAIFDLDIIEKHVKIKNNGTEAIHIERAYSSEVILPHRDVYRLTTFCGGWASEYQKKQHILDRGQFLMESKNGLSGPEFAPFFMIDDSAEATESNGMVYFGSLVWSGNWSITVTKDCFDRTVITGGINDFDFCWELKGGESFETPKFVLGYTEGGFGDVGRKTVDYERLYIMNENDAKRDVPLVYNAFGTYMSQINEKKIMSIIDKAADIGVELFVMDSGWSGKGDDTCFEYRHGFGDWDVNKDRFPNGLLPISDKIHKKGMKFGLWLQPEIVNPNSNLFKKHPEWVYCSPSRKLFKENYGYLLNFANDDICDYMTNKIIKIVEDNKLDYFKMDFCCGMQVFVEKGTDTARQKELWVRHTRNLYKCYETLKKRFPDIIIENCAGGGCHISKMYTKHINGRNSTMKFQAETAMLGSMAIGLNLNTITDEEVKELKTYVKKYKEIRPIVHHGDFYRLESPQVKPYAAFLAVSKDKNDAVLFVFSQSLSFARMPERIRLDGLDEKAVYMVEGYKEITGRGLMNVGLQIPLRGDMDSRVIKIKKII